MENHKCKECHKKFYDKSNLNRHMRSKTHNSEKNGVNISVIGDNNITTTNINFINFNQESLDCISSKQIVNIIRKHKDNVNIILDYLEIVNFNNRYPENHNLYVSNKRTKDINVFENDSWVLKDKSFSREIIIEVLLFIQSEYEKNKKLLNKEIQAKFEKMAEYTDYTDIQLSNDKIFRGYSRDVVNYLYNNREIVMDLLSK